MNRPNGFRAVAFSAVLCAFAWSSPVFGADFEKLSAPENLAITIDPLQPVASITFPISNGTAKPSSLNLRLEGFTGTLTHVAPHDATVKLFLNGVESTLKQPDILAPKGEIYARIDVTELTESGEYSVNLFNGPVALTRVQIAGIPFRVHPDVAAGMPVAVVVGPDRLHFSLRNDDPFVYPVKWEIDFEAGTVKGTAAIHSNSTEVFCSRSTQSCKWNVSENGWDWFSGYLRDSSYDGRLRIELAAPGQRPAGSPQFLPLVSYPIKVALRDHSPELTGIAGSVVLVLVLTLGAIVSLITNLWIPHNLRKNALNSRLVLAIRRIRELSAGMPSRGRISAEVDCFQIMGRLKNEGAFYSDFDVILLDYEAQVSAIESRVALMAQVDECRSVLEGITSLSVPPSLITSAREPLHRLTRMLDGGEWTDAQLRSAAALADDLQHRVSGLSEIQSSGRVDADVQARILAELKRLKCLFPAPRTGIAKQFDEALPGIFGVLGCALATTPDPVACQWARLDSALWKLSTIERFISAYGMTSDSEWRCRLEKKAGLVQPVSKGSLVYYLELNTCDALECAQLLCTQIDQGIFPEDICKAICDGRFSIEILQQQITSERRVDVEIRFRNYAYDNAAARLEITPHWTFTPHSPRSLRGRLAKWMKLSSGAGEPRRESGGGVWSDPIDWLKPRYVLRTGLAKYEPGKMRKREGSHARSSQTRPDWCGRAF
jgi:hypothetical protein